MCTSQEVWLLDLPHAIVQISSNYSVAIAECQRNAQYFL